MGIHKTNSFKWNVAWLQNLLVLACESEMYCVCVCVRMYVDRFDS